MIHKILGIFHIKIMSILVAMIYKIISEKIKLYKMLFFFTRNPRLYVLYCFGKLAFKEQTNTKTYLHLYCTIRTISYYIHL